TKPKKKRIKFTFFFFFSFSLPCSMFFFLCSFTLIGYTPLLRLTCSTALWLIYEKKQTYILHLKDPILLPSFHPQPTCINHIPHTTHIYTHTHHFFFQKKKNPAIRIYYIFYFTGINESVQRIGVPFRDHWPGHLKIINPN